VANTLTQPHRISLRPVHLLLGAQSLIIVLLTINRLTALTTGYVLPNEFLRWVDLNNMLLLPLASLLASFALWKVIVRAGSLDDGRSRFWLGLGFVVGVYLLGAGYGDHEVTNYLHVRFCLDGAAALPEALCRIIVYNDDEFSHYVFFIGYLLMNAMLMLVQAAAPWPGRVEPQDLILLLVNGLFIAAGVFANLAFEEIGLDLYVVAALALLSLYLLRRFGRQPLLVYYAVAYGLSTLATAVVKLVG
jgi:hypothetical protein